MKRAIVLFVGCVLLLAQHSVAQLDRSKIPPPGPAPEVAFPDYDMATTSNGIRVLVIQNTELPTVAIRLLIDRKPILEGEAAGVIDVMGEAMKCGTATRTKDQIDEEIDQLGGSLGAGGTALYASGLSRHTEKLLALLADIAVHPTFPKEEVERVVMQAQSGLKARKMEPNSIVDVVRKRVLYGDAHPYGEVETEATIGKVTPEKCQALYTAYFKPNHAIIAVVGDVQKNAVMGLIEKYFGGWQQGPLPVANFPEVKSLASPQVALVDRPSSVQSVLRVTHIVNLQRTSPDVMPVSVMNRILGGGAADRLFMNLREKHSYTYGAYSSIGPDELVGAFTAMASVRNVVTDSALTEVLNEIKRIRNEDVAAGELDQAKNALAGNFVASLEVPNTIASYALEIERHGLPKDYFKTYLKRLAAVTVADVRAAAQRYLDPDHVLIAVVGSQKEIGGKLGVFGTVTMYDEDGNKVVEKPVSAVKISVDQILAKFVDRTGGKKAYAAIKDRTMELSAKVQGMDMKLKTIQKAPDKFYQETSMMGMVQRTAFDGKAGWAGSPRGIMDVTGEELESLKNEGVIDFYAVYKKLGYKADVTGVKDIKGKEAYEVTFTGTTGSSMRHYFDTKEFLKIREAKMGKTPRGPIEQVSDLAEYKAFGGVLIPVKIEESVMGQTFTLTVDKCDVNTKVQDAVFAKPAK
jgi:zinc protease